MKKSIVKNCKLTPISEQKFIYYYYYLAVWYYSFHVFSDIEQKKSDLCILFYVNNLGKRKGGSKATPSHVGYHPTKEHRTQMFYRLAAFSCQKSKKL